MSLKTMGAGQTVGINCAVHEFHWRGACFVPSRILQKCFHFLQRGAKRKWSRMARVKLWMADGRPPEADDKACPRSLGTWL